MAYVLCPPLRLPEGDAIASGSMETYLAGTSTPLATYSDDNGTANPTTISLDASGRPSGAIFLSTIDANGSPVSYKFVVKDSAGTTLYTQDDVRAGGTQLFDLTGTVNMEEYTTLQDAVTAIGSDVRTLVVSANRTVSANTTVPSNITLLFIGDGQLSVDALKTVTINGPIEAPPKQIFSGSGTVAISGRVFPEWWGAVGDKTTDDYTAIQAALAALKAGNGGVLDCSAAPSGYYIATGLTLAYTADSEARIDIVGGSDRSEFYTDQAIDMLTISTTTGNVRRLSLRNLMFNGNSLATNGVVFTSGAYNRIINCHFANFDGAGVSGIKLNNCGRVEVLGNFFVHHQTNGRAVTLTGTTNRCLVATNMIGEDVAYGVYMGSSTTFNTVTANQMTSLSKVGVFDSGTGNVTRGNLIESADSQGVHLYTATRAIVESNSILDSGGHGVTVEGDAGTPTYADNNKVRDNDFKGGTTTDIRVPHVYARYTEIAGNSTDGTATTGINNLGAGTIVGRNFGFAPESPGADQGDSDATLTALVDEEIQRWDTPLTANRTITLSATNAFNGARFRVVRTGLGAFTLDVGGLKTIPSATAAFVDVMYDGSAWVLTGYGTL